MDTMRHYLNSTVGRLTASYFAIIVVLTLVFSLVIFSIAASRLEGPGRSQYGGSAYERIMRERTEELFQERAAAAKLDLFLSLVLFNILIDTVGAVLSYYLARRTLEPIEAALAAQAQFVSDASHELRTPLTALQTTNEVALRKKTLKLAEAKIILQQNVDEVVKLRTLSNALLGLAGKKRELSARESANLQDVVTDAMQPIVPVAQQKNIGIEDGVENITLALHRTNVEQITRILLDNAIKYSSDGSTVHISTQRFKHYVRLMVSDEGIGIADDQKDKIFDRFYRVDSARTKVATDGYGLGLAIAASLVEGTGMRLELMDSRPGKGSTFALEIPRE